MKLTDIKILEESDEFIYSSNINKETEGIIITFEDNSPTGYIIYDANECAWVYTDSIAATSPIEFEDTLPKLLNIVKSSHFVTNFKLLKF